MIDTVNTLVQDWHWLVFGMLLILLEIFIPSFTIFWFGLGAIIVAVLVWLPVELDFSAQLFIWVISSSIFAALWFKYFRPLMVDRTKAGISREAVIGETGQVVQIPVDEKRGIVRFTTPLLGNDEWDFICDAPVELGDRVRVSDVSGNTLIVLKNA